MTILEGFTIREAYLLGMFGGMFIFALWSILTSLLNYIDEKVRKMYRDRIIKQDKA